MKKAARKPRPAAKPAKKATPVPPVATVVKKQLQSKGCRLSKNLMEKLDGIREQIVKDITQDETLGASKAFLTRPYLTPGWEPATIEYLVSEWERHRLH